MYTFLKAQASSLLASLVDFAATILGVELIGMTYGLANAGGNAVGAVANFAINKNWVFTSSQDRAVLMAKYLLVWVGYVILSSVLVVLVTGHTGINYIIAKTAVAIVLSFSYNYSLQKKFVFK